MLPPPPAQHPLLGAVLLVAALQPRSLLSSAVTSWGMSAALLHLGLSTWPLCHPLRRCTCQQADSRPSAALRVPHTAPQTVPLCPHRTALLEHCHRCSRDGPAKPAAWGTETQVVLLLPFRQPGS